MKITIHIPVPMIGWRVQVHPWQSLRRWLFTRCAHCHRRFAWRESPISHQWGGNRTPWFGGTPGLYHQDCDAEHSRIRQSDDVQHGAGFCPPII